MITQGQMFLDFSDETNFTNNNKNNVMHTDEELCIYDNIRYCFFFFVYLLESRVSHQISKCIQNYVEKHKIINVEDLQKYENKITEFKRYEGKGIEALFMNKFRIKIGTAKYILSKMQHESSHVLTKPEQIHQIKQNEDMLFTKWVNNKQRKNCVVFMLSVNELCLGAVCLKDFIPENSVYAVKYMKENLNCDVYMCTGDSLKAATRVCRRINLPEENVAAEMLPDEKLKFIQLLKYSAKKEIKKFLLQKRENINSESIFYDEKSVYANIYNNPEEEEKKEKKEKKNSLVSILDNVLFAFKHCFNIRKANNYREMSESETNNFVLSNNNKEFNEIKNEKNKTNFIRRIVCMVGDGINDCPALKCADVGICLGTANNISLFSSDVIITSQNLLDVANYIKLSAAAMGTIRRNFIWAGIFNAIGLPIAAGAFYPYFVVNPILCALMMTSSSIGVLLSSLLLKKHKRIEKKTTVSSLYLKNKKIKENKIKKPKAWFVQKFINFFSPNTTLYTNVHESYADYI